MGIIRRQVLNCVTGDTLDGLRSTVYRDTMKPQQTIRKGPQLRTVRVDDDVWLALKRQPLTLNQLLRKVLRLDEKRKTVRR